VGSAKQSQHLLANAADIVVVNVALREVVVVAEKIVFRAWGGTLILLMLMLDSVQIYIVLGNYSGTCFLATPNKGTESPL